MTAMAPKATPQANRTFDETKLIAMVEPLTVRVEKKKGSSITPVPLPTSEDQSSPGTNWSKSDVRNIETWLCTEWSGGGYYVITVTDSSEPTPMVMKWEPFFPINDFPEKVPPPLADAARSQPQQPTPPPTLHQVRPMNPAFPGGLPPGLQNVAAPASAPGFQYPYTAPNPYYAQPPMAAQAYGQNQMQFAQQAQLDAERRRIEEAAQREAAKIEAERKRLEEQNAKQALELQQMRDREMQAKHERELAQVRAAADESTKRVEKQMEDLRTQMVGLMTALKDGTAKNPELEALKLQAQQAEQRAEAERREREQERRDQQMRDMIKANQETAQRQIEAVQRQFEQFQQLVAKMGENRGPDPAMTLVKEIMTQSQAAMKDMQQQSALQFERMQQFVMKPTDMLMLTKESQSSVDQVTSRMTSQFEGVMNMQNRVMETFMQLQPQGSGAAEIIRDGVSGFKDLAERYLTTQNAKAQVHAQTQVAMAQLQAQAQAQAIAAAQAVQPPAPVTAPPTQLAGAGGKKPRKIKKVDEPAAIAAPSIDNGPKRHGRSDLEWFGPQLLVEVLQLREGVDQYIESLATGRADEKTGQPVGISVEMAAMGVMQASLMITQAGAQIPAMTDLLNQQLYADFMDVLLPDAPQAYRDDVAQLVEKQMRGAGSGRVVAVANDKSDDDDEDGDEEDDADPDADENDGKVTPINNRPTARPAARA